jgi:hypothetical protein
MTMAIVGWVAATSLGLLAIAVLIAVIDNRLNYGRWRRRSTDGSTVVGPQTPSDRDAFYGGGGGGGGVP